MKKLCIFLMQVHRFYYLLLGALIGAIVFSKVGNVQDMIPTADMNPLIPMLLIFGTGYMQVFAMAAFYTEEERVTNEINENINTFGGLVQWDNYFPIKINTELPMTKRLCGYVYVILRAVLFLASGYLSLAIICLLTNK